MILRRLGNKKKISGLIKSYFPEHKIYVEPFFGAGGMFFNKEKSHNNLLNDNDSEVFNLFMVCLNQSKEFKELFLITPYSQELINYWSLNQEIDPIKKAVRFLFLSNYVLMGKGSSIRVEAKKSDFYKNFDRLLSETRKGIQECTFCNMDFRKFINTIAFINDGRDDQKKTFIYCDPPYLDVSNNYQSGFTEKDSTDLFDILEEKKCMFMVSEFDHPFILDQIKKRNLNKIVIGDRNNIKNRRIEIVITNYSQGQKSLF